MLKVIVFLGDGIGPEISMVVVQVLQALIARFQLPLSLMVAPCGLEALAQHGSTFPRASLDAATLADGIILGPLSTYQYPAPEAGGTNASALLRRRLDLYANIRPSRSHPGIAAANDGLDVILVRENSEGFYAVRNMFAGSGEFCPDADTAFSLRSITAAASRRIAREAFAVARAMGRRRVTAIHKANVLKLTDGLFLRECRAISSEHPEIAYDEELVDAAAAKLVSTTGYDVLVTTNLFGDILSNQAAALVGGLGLAASLNLGEHHAMAQAVHGSAPDIAGRNCANPVSLILSSALLLRWLGHKRDLPNLTAAASELEDAVSASLNDPTARTMDVAGVASTSEVGEALVRLLSHCRRRVATPTALVEERL